MPACYIPTKINSQDMKFLQNLTKLVGFQPHFGQGNIEQWRRQTKYAS